MLKALNIITILQDRFFPLLYLLVISTITIFMVSRDIPRVGHDYGYHIPRMLDAYLHQEINGFEIQWFTPSFGGGLPSYPNPQDIQYSLPQLLMFILNPWVSLMLSLFIYSSIGFISFYFLLKNECRLSKNASLLGAIFILANGFYVEHAIVGHVGFQQFPLLGVIFYLMFSKKIKPIPSGIFLGATIALIVHQSGFYVIVIFLLSLLIMIPLMSLLVPQVVHGRRWILACLTGTLVAFLLSASKLSAVYSFMRFFPRQVSDVYGKTYFQGILGIVLQMAGGMVLIPYYLLTGKELSEISVLFHRATGANYGIWETDISISPAIFLLLFLGIISVFRSLPKMKGIKSSQGKIVPLAILLFGIWLAADFTLSQGWLYQFINSLPIIRSLHVNVRFASAFIFPLSFLGAYIFDTYSRIDRRITRRAFILINFFALSFLPFYLFLPPQEHHRSFNLNSSMWTYAQIKQGERFPIQEIVNVVDSNVFKKNASNFQKLREPLFGYGLEYFNPRLQIGPVFEVNNGCYNMTNPVSYVFPEDNNLQQFDCFLVDQKENLELFINRKQPVFNLPARQKIADIFNLIALAALISYIMFKMVIISKKLWHATFP